MGVEFKLSDRELPVSPAFVLVLAQLLLGTPIRDDLWVDQISEELASGGDDLPARAARAAEAVMSQARGRELVARAYTLLAAMLIGELEPLRELQSRFQFVAVIGAPRSGGSYLTAELYRAIGLVPEEVPSALAHDSFPEAGPFDLQPGANGWMMTLKTTAEYLTLVEFFFGGRPAHEGKIVVPKKLTKAAYAGGFFRRALGESTEQVLTLRHPAAACVSTYEKSGGLPADRRFAVRSNIEEWCRRELVHGGVRAERVGQLDYFDAYLRYWEQFNLSLVTTGLPASRPPRVMAYGRAVFESAAQAYHERYRSGSRATSFQVSDKARRLHPDWVERSRPAVERVADAWERAGIPFPREDVERCD